MKNYIPNENSSALNEIINYLPDILYKIDVNGVYTFISNSIQKLGYKPDELMGKHFTVILHPDDRDRVSREIMLPEFRGKPADPGPKLFDERRAGKRLTKKLKLRLVPKEFNKDKDLTYEVEVYSLGAYEDEKYFSGTLGLIRDISDVKRLEKSLILTEQFYRNIIDNSSEVLTILDTDYTILHKSNSHLKVTGIDATETLGNSELNYIHPDDRKKYYDEIDKHIHNNAYPGFFQYRYINATEEWHTFETSVHIFKNNNDEPVSILTYARDITERKALEDELKKNEQRYRGIIESVPILICRHNVADHSVSYANDTFIKYFKKNKNQIIGKKLKNILPKVLYTSIKKNIKHLSDSAPIKKIEVHLEEKEQRWLQWTDQIIEDDHGNIIEYQSIGEDITEAKLAHINLEQRLELEEAIGEISSLFTGFFDIDYSTEKTLQIIGKLTNAERGYIFSLDEENTEFTTTHEWCSNNVKPKMAERQKIKTSLLPWWTKKIQSNRVINITDINELPDEAAVDKELFKKESINSMLVMPFNIFGKPKACIAVENSRKNFCWNKNDLKLLKTVTEIISNAIERETITMSIEKDRKQLLSIFNSINQLIYVSDIDSYTILFVNKALQKKLGYDPLGKKCHEVLQNSNTPCSFCTNKIIKERAFQPYTWEFYNNQFNKHYLITDKMIKWTENIEARFEIAIDITALKKTELKLKDALDEKEILLKEVHHRVKNNMQVITSLINLQATKLKGTEYYTIFLENINRIQAMALIHEKIYRANNYSRVPFNEYLKDLVSNLVSTYSVASDISLQYDMDDSKLTIDKAIPCAQIANELVTNSIKYAFSDNKDNIIKITFYTKNNHCSLFIEDNGKGLEKNFDISNATSFGLTIVNSLVSQLRGTLDYKTDQGTSFKISFPA